MDNWQCLLAVGKPKELNATVFFQNKVTYFYLVLSWFTHWTKGKFISPWLSTGWCPLLDHSLSNASTGCWALGSPALFGRWIPPSPPCTQPGPPPSVLVSQPPPSPALLPQHSLAPASAGCAASSCAASKCRVSWLEPHKPADNGLVPTNHATSLTSQAYCRISLCVVMWFFKNFILAKR